MQEFRSKKSSPEGQVSRAPGGKNTVSQSLMVRSVENLAMLAAAWRIFDHFHKRCVLGFMCGEKSHQ